MKDKTKAYIAGAVIVIAAFAAETITASAHGIAWEEAHGQPIITSMESFAPYTHEEMELMARCVQAEYGNGDEMDKRLVTAVILNRLESDLPDFNKHNTVEKVIRAPGQFAIADSYSIETLDAVYKEVAERTNGDILWFSAGSYPKWGTPILQHNAHYFSGVTE